MPRIKRKSSRIGKIHDRRAHELPLNAEVVAVEVDDPMALEPGDKIVALRSTRGDPLGWLHSHHQIDDAQYRGAAHSRTTGNGPSAGRRRSIPPANMSMACSGASRSPKANATPCCASIVPSASSAPTARHWSMMS